MANTVCKHMVQKYLNLGFGSIFSIIWRCMYANIYIYIFVSIYLCNSPNPTLKKKEPTGLPHGRVEALLPQRMASTESHHLGNTLTYINRPQWKALTSKNIHPGRVTWNLKITQLQRQIIFQTIIFRFHVNLPRCILPPYTLRVQNWLHKYQKLGYWKRVLVNHFVDKLCHLLSNYCNVLHQIFLGPSSIIN